MGWHDDSTKTNSHEPFFHTKLALAAATNWIIGPGGDVDPGKGATARGNDMAGVLVRNNGPAAVLRVAAAAADLTTGTSYVDLQPGEALSIPRTLRTLALRNTDGSATCDLDVVASLNRTDNAA